MADAVIPFTAKQHLYNERWPQHAKFHNCQTMLIGMGLGILALTVLFASQPLTTSRLYLAAMLAGLYFVSMLLAPIFPGTAWTDPEFLSITPMPLGLHPQMFVASIVVAVLVLTCVIAV